MTTLTNPERAALSYLLRADGNTAPAYRLREVSGGRSLVDVETLSGLADRKLVNVRKEPGKFHQYTLEQAGRAAIVADPLAALMRKLTDGAGMHRLRSLLGEFDGDMVVRAYEALWLRAYWAGDGREIHKFGDYEIRHAGDVNVKASPTAVHTF